MHPIGAYFHGPLQRLRFTACIAVETAATGEIDPDTRQQWEALCGILYDGKGEPTGITSGKVGLGLDFDNTGVAIGSYLDGLARGQANSGASKLYWNADACC